MGPLRACPRCDGLVPSRLAACPHCDAPVRARGRLARAVAGALGGVGLMTTLMACYGVPARCDPKDDKDGDGYCPAGRYRDCDDGNAAVHPHATEIAGNGVDENCDGTDGSGAPAGSAATP